METVADDLPMAGRREPLGFACLRRTSTESQGCWPVNRTGLLLPRSWASPASRLVVRREDRLGMLWITVNVGAPGWAAAGGLALLWELFLAMTWDAD